MGQVFLSYAREDRPFVERLARVLEHAGYEVWWDRRLESGGEFSAEIEAALDKSDVVLVVWSKESTKSRWVRDEAAVGGDTGKIVPVSIDSSLPPMGFRQFHTLDLTDWKGGKRDERTAELLHSVERRLKGKAAAARVAKPKRRFRFAGAKRMWTAALAVAFLAIGTFILLGRTARTTTPGLSVALLPFAADASDVDARKLAAATHDAVAHTLSGGPFVISTVDAPPRSGRTPADFLISGQISRTPDKVVISVRTEETAHHLLVSEDQFEASRDKAWELPERVGAQVAAGASWSAPLLALERRHPSDPAIVTAFLQSSSGTLQTLDDLHEYEQWRRLVAKAPNSPLALYNFAFSTVWAFPQLPREERAEAVAAARRAVDRTLKLAPEFGGGYVLWCLLHSEQRRVQCEDRLRAGMRADPGDAFSPWFLSYLLHNVGRNREATELARISLALDQYRTFRIGLMLRMLEVTGQTVEAADLYERSTHWYSDDHDIIWYRAGGMYLRGDFEAAQQFHRQLSDGARSNFHPVAGLVSALKSNSASRVRSACAHVSQEDGGTLQCMLGLARVGDLDGAYRFADDNYPSRRGRTPAEEERLWLEAPNPPNALAYITSPAAAPLRRDPRYIALAERVGLLEYWRSGRPPDFCRQNPEPICAQLLKRS
ncbi:MAG TPA: toll/interleukin-1 receptor domain-containing protein [Sphingomicrobium sp.]|nr:toll/interleukin-1 receptor domain-containing protein [Sphingomicrobium sp.]